MNAKKIVMLLAVIAIAFGVMTFMKKDSTPSTSNDSVNIEHTHEDGLVHSHEGGDVKHSHTEEAPVTEETPVTEEAPVTEETPVTEENPVTE